MIYALKQVDGGETAVAVCRKMGMSEATSYNWKKRYSGMGVSDVRELRQLRDENAKLASERDDLKHRVVSCVPDEVIAGVLEQFPPSLERRGIQIEWCSEAHERVLADPDASHRSAGGGWLGMTSTLREGRLRVRVADRGPGIAARHEKRIFGAFERIETAVNEGSSGTGLGLSIARDLARRGNGELCLVAAPEGTVFELDLPAPLAPH